MCGIVRIYIRTLRIVRMYCRNLLIERIYLCQKIRYRIVFGELWLKNEI